MVEDKSDEESEESDSTNSMNVWGSRFRFLNCGNAVLFCFVFMAYCVI